MAYNYDDRQEYINHLRESFSESARDPSYDRSRASRGMEDTNCKGTFFLESPTVSGLHFVFGIFLQ